MFKEPEGNWGGCEGQAGTGKEDPSQSLPLSYSRQDGKPGGFRQEEGGLSAPGSAHRGGGYRSPGRDVESTWAPGIKRGGRGR